MSTVALLLAAMLGACSALGQEEGFGRSEWAERWEPIETAGWGMLALFAAVCRPA